MHEKLYTYARFEAHAVAVALGSFECLLQILKAIFYQNSKKNRDVQKIFNFDTNSSLLN